MSFEDGVLAVIDGLANFNFPMFFRVLFVGLILFWVFVLVWVWSDASARSNSTFFKIVSVLLALFLNVLGLLIYLLIRPKEFIDDTYWTELERRYLLFETQELIDCENCGTSLRPEFNACPNCAFPVRHNCVKCESIIDNGWAYCPYCAAPQFDSEQITLPVDSEETKQEDPPTAIASESDSPATEDSKDSSANDTNPPEQEESNVQDKKGGRKKKKKHKNAGYEKQILKPAEKLGKNVMSGVMSLGERIHMTALRISGPLVPVDNKAKETGEKEKPQK